MRVGEFDADDALGQLRTLFDLGPIFKRRGLTVAAFEEREHLLLDPEQDSELFYDLLSDTSFRIVGAVVANSGPLRLEEIRERLKWMNPEVLQSHLRAAINASMIIEDGEVYRTPRDVGFGSTLECYVAAVLVREFASIAYWGVRVLGLPADYDVVVIRDTQLGYIECKSGRLANIDDADLYNFLDRERRLCPAFSAILIDGISREAAGEVAQRLAQVGGEYRWTLPPLMDQAIQLKVEEYRWFSRLVPINCFVLDGRRPVASSLGEVYRFLTAVRDRALPIENETAKAQFRDGTNSGDAI